MTSRSDFAIELAALERQLADRPARPRRPEPPEPDPVGPLASLLGDHVDGVKSLEDLWDRLNTELDGVPQDKPLLTALAALGIGYLLGRTTR